MYLGTGVGVKVDPDDICRLGHTKRSREVLLLGMYIFGGNPSYLPHPRASSFGTVVCRVRGKALQKVKLADTVLLMID